jgi:hypothetical protein
MADADPNGGGLCVCGHLLGAAGILSPCVSWFGVSVERNCLVIDISMLVSRMYDLYNCDANHPSVCLHKCL